MIREKIFRLHRHKSTSSSAGADASGQKLDFTFSNIRAIQVPRGWDKVSLSLISSESGKVARKTGKAPVKNGACQWSEIFAESIWISDVDSSTELEEHLVKFLLASGSSKSSILGETTLNLAAFLSSESPMLVSLPLKKCNYGTILQVEVKCLTPKTNIRDEKWREMHANNEENGADHDNIENQSDISDCTTAKSGESNSSRLRELSSRETSFSASVSRYSFESIDDSVGRQSFSSQSDRNGGDHLIARQDSVESNDSSSYSTHDSLKSVRSHQSKNRREEFRKIPNAKTFKEADGAVIQELEAEARMWEQNARKLYVDLERLRKELSDQNVNMTNLNIELETSRSDCHGLTQEIERLKLILNETSTKQDAGQNSEVQETAWSNIQKVLEDEIRFQKEENENLSVQLGKTQESNLELIAVLQEMEETIDKQKLEIETLLMADNREKIRREDNRVLELELLNSRELPQSLRGEISILKNTFQERILEIEIEQDLKNRVLKEFVLECNNKYRSMIFDGNDDDLLKEEEDFKDVSCQNITDELRLMDLETSQAELVKHLSELQEENIYLSQRVSGLEAQLRYLTDRNESTHLELQDWESKVMVLESQIRMLEEEIKTRKVDTKQKLLDMQKQWLEAQEECLALSKLNINLQATTESLVEEYNSLQNFNGELREQKSKLQERCLVLESEARKYRNEVRENLERSDRGNKVVLAAKNVMNGESKRKSIVDDLELRISLSEIERLRLAEENSLLHMQLQKVPGLQDEVLALRVSFEDVKSRNQLLEASQKSLSEGYEELKSENISMVEKICSMQNAVLEADACRRKKNALEEKILRLEGDFIARDALCVQNVEMKNELNQIKIANSQLLMKVKYLEDLRQDLQSRVKSLEQELKKTTRDVEETRSKLTLGFCSASSSDFGQTR